MPAIRGTLHRPESLAPRTSLCRAVAGSSAAVLVVQRRARVERLLHHPAHAAHAFAARIELADPGDRLDEHAFATRSAERDPGAGHAGRQQAEDRSDRIPVIGLVEPSLDDVAKGRRRRAFTELPDRQVEPGLTPFEQFDDRDLALQRGLDLDHHGAVGMRPQVQWTGDAQRGPAVGDLGTAAGHRRARAACQFRGHRQLAGTIDAVGIGDEQAARGHARPVQVDVGQLQTGNQLPLQREPALDQGFRDDHKISRHQPTQCRRRRDHGRNSLGIGAGIRFLTWVSHQIQSRPGDHADPSHDRLKLLGIVLFYFLDSRISD